MNICFHVDEETRWQVCLANVANTLNYFEDENESGEVVIVVNAQAVRTLVETAAKDAGIHDDLRAFMEKGVGVKVCVNALRAQEIAEDHLLEGVDVIPAGIIELANRQKEGFAYIRP